jgi:hypothetical protein
MGLVLISPAVSVLAGAPAVEREIRFSTPQAALDQGLGAYRAGFYHLALPALKYAADNNLFLGRFYLARLYADRSSSMTDHSKAYRLYQEIVEQHAASIDVDDDERAPYVGRALTAVAGYIYRGLPEIELVASAERAAQFFQEAATFFRDPDAQFELAKLYLKGDGVVEDRKTALHWLSRLTQDGHAGAQAFLADLQWRGKFVKQDGQSALALITIAAENAPGPERIWIEEIYQNIYCNSAPNARRDAEPLITSSRRLYSPRGGAALNEGISDLGLSPARTCGNGEPLPNLSTRAGQAGSGQVVRNAAPATNPGSSMGVGVMGVGEPTIPPSGKP